MIKKYKQALDEMGQLYGGEAVDEVALQREKAAVEKALQEEGNESQEREKESQGSEKGGNHENKRPSDDEAAETEEKLLQTAPTVALPEGETTDFAYFSANVFSGEEAYPVQGARIVVYRGDNIYAFLSTDENGSTKRIRLPAFSRENSLEADNPDKTVDYQADIFAEGFNAQKGLLVGAVGGSDIILRVILVPEGERIG